MVSREHMVRIIVLSVLTLLITTSAFYTWMMDAVAESRGCLVGTLTSSITIKPQVSSVRPSTSLIVKAVANITYFTEKRECLVRLTVRITPIINEGVKIYYTPPLVDMAVRTDAGEFTWSEGKLFIQAIVEKNLPLSETLEMKVKGSCVYEVEAIVRPLELHLPLGAQVGTPTSSEITHYIVCGVFKTPVTYGNITIRRVSFEVAAPREVSYDMVKSEVSRILNEKFGNLSRLLKIDVIPIKSAGISTVPVTGVWERVVPLTTKPEPQKSLSQEVEITANIAGTTSTSVTASTTSKYLPSAGICEPLSTIPSEYMREESESAACVPYLPRELSIPLAAAAAVIAGLVAYVLLIKPLK